VADGVLAAFSSPHYSSPYFLGHNFFLAAISRRAPRVSKFGGGY
jgi:hypothetical protein